MKAIYYERFCGPVELRTLPDPSPSPDGVVIQVAAAGLCRSDWHGWQGHDPDIALPHVPGHELAGVITEVGKQVSRWQIGDRVTLPFCMGCGSCRQCRSGNQQICDDYFQPGFTGWGAFAEYVAVPYADHNVVQLPESLDFTEAAMLGCRFITAYRALIAQGRLQPGEWVAIHACGGVGLSAILIARAAGARIIAIDVSPDQLELAAKLGADHLINARQSADVVREIRTLSGGGVQVSIDALGSTETCLNSIACLAKRGRHLQVGLMTAEHSQPPIPMAPVIANELEIIGSHGMQAHAYPEMLSLITSGRINLQALLGRTIRLEQAAEALMQFGTSAERGVTVIDMSLNIDVENIF